MPDVTVPLSRPLHIVDSGARGPTRERFISEVTLREPTGRDLRLYDRHQGEPVALALALIQALGGLTKAQTNRLAATDVAALSRVALDALEPFISTAGLAGGLSPVIPDRRT